MDSVLKVMGIILLIDFLWASYALIRYRLKNRTKE